MVPGPSTPIFFILIPYWAKGTKNHLGFFNNGTYISAETVCTFSSKFLYGRANKTYASMYSEKDRSKPILLEVYIGMAPVPMGTTLNFRITNFRMTNF
jgi:hypothetical protein